MFEKYTGSLYRWTRRYDKENKTLHIIEYVVLVPLQVSALLVFFLSLGLASLLRSVATRTGMVNSRPAPPINAEFLFYLFMTPHDCDALVGDLEERFKLIRKKFGKRRADFWYWTQAIRSVGPIVWAWMKKSFAKPFVAAAGWAIAKGVVAHDSWLAAVLEVWKRIRS